MGQTYILRDVTKAPGTKSVLLRCYSLWRHRLAWIYVLCWDRPAEICYCWMSCSSYVLMNIKRLKQSSKCVCVHMFDSGIYKRCDTLSHCLLSLLWTDECVGDCTYLEAGALGRNITTQFFAHCPNELFEFYPVKIRRWNTYWYVAINQWAHYSPNCSCFTGGSWLYLQFQANGRSGLTVCTTFLCLCSSSWSAE